MKMRWTSGLVRAYVPLACTVIAMSLLACLGFHQVLRSQGDDPQVHLAEDAARLWQAGSAPATLIPAGTVPLESSLAPFLMLFDREGAPLASSARLHGVAPVLPVGVFAHARARGEHRLSWQPEPGIREAIVVVAVGRGQLGYVVAGRSLRGTERRKLQVLHLFAMGCLGILLGLLPVVAAFKRQDLS